MFMHPIPTAHAVVEQSYSALIVCLTSHLSIYTINIDSSYNHALNITNFVCTLILWPCTSKSTVVCHSFTKPCPPNLQLLAAKRLPQMRQGLLYCAAPHQGHRTTCLHQLSCSLSSLRQLLLLMLPLEVQQQHHHLSNNKQLISKHPAHSDRTEEAKAGGWGGGGV